MRVLFLDIDEVLNSTQHPGQGAGPEEAKRQAEMAQLDPKLSYGEPEYYAQAIDPFHVKVLNEITDATSAVIVVSSSWRNAHPLNKLRQIFKAAGIKGFVIGDTPIRLVEEGQRRHRYDEIQAWLDVVQPIEGFAILDDVPMGPLAPHQIKTEDDTGLLPEHAERAIALLVNSKCTFCGKSPATRHISTLTPKQQADNQAWSNSFKDGFHTGHCPHLELPTYACDDCPQCGKPVEIQGHSYPCEMSADHQGDCDRWTDPETGV